MLTTVPSLCADYLEIWEPPGSLRACVEIALPLPYSLKEQVSIRNVCSTCLDGPAKTKREVLHESQCLSCKRQASPYLDIQLTAFIKQQVCDVRLVVHNKQEGERVTGA